jgi:hypothetical protein
MQISGAPVLSLRYPECFLQLPSQIERAELTGKSRGVYGRNKPYLLNLILLFSTEFFLAPLPWVLMIIFALFSQIISQNNKLQYLTSFWQAHY